MLINMAAVRIVQMTVVQIVDVIVMPDGSMTALRAVRMSMIFVLWQVTIRHCRFLIKNRLNSAPPCNMTLPMQYE
jgi:hypothetical protein